MTEYTISTSAFDMIVCADSAEAAIRSVSSKIGDGEHVVRCGAAGFVMIRYDVVIFDDEVEIEHGVTF